MKDMAVKLWGLLARGMRLRYSERWLLRICTGWLYVHFTCGIEADRRERCSSDVRLKARLPLAAAIQRHVARYG